MQSLRFVGKVAIVTGAGSDIGAATARRFWSEGAAVVLVGRTYATLAKVAESLDPARCLIEIADVSKVAEVARVIANAIARFGAIDVVVNSAGLVGVGPFLHKSDADWNEGVGVNLFGVLYIIRAALPHLLKTKSAIVNVSSIAGLGGEARNVLYGATKAALKDLTEGLASELGPTGVRVNSVCPGVIHTDGTAMLFDPALPPIQLRREAVDRVPLGRPGHAEEIAAVVAFLASSDASFVSGVSIPVDGGAAASNEQIRWGG